MLRRWRLLMPRGNRTFADIDSADSITFGNVHVLSSSDLLGCLFPAACRCSLALAGLGNVQVGVVCATRFSGDAGHPERRAADVQDGQSLRAWYSS